MKWMKSKSKNWMKRMKWWSKLDEVDEVKKQEWWTVLDERMKWWIGLDEMMKWIWMKWWNDEMNLDEIAGRWKRIGWNDGIVVKWWKQTWIIICVYFKWRMYRIGQICFTTRVSKYNKLMPPSVFYGFEKPQNFRPPRRQKRIM